MSSSAMIMVESASASAAVTKTSTTMEFHHGHIGSDEWQDEELEFLTDALLTGTTTSTDIEKSVVVATTVSSNQPKPTSIITSRLLSLHVVSLDSPSCAAAVIGTNSHEISDTEESVVSGAEIPSELVPSSLEETTTTTAVTPSHSSRNFSLVSAATSPSTMTATTAPVMTTTTTHLEATLVPVSIVPVKAPSSPRIFSPATKAAKSAFPACTPHNIRPQKPSSARDSFLRAVAIAVAEQRSTIAAIPDSTQSSSSTLTSQENNNSNNKVDQITRQRERNRIMAKQTRERKKTAMASLKLEFGQLTSENAMLTQLIQQHLPATAAETLMQGSIVSQIPDVVWEACGTEQHMSVYPTPQGLLSSLSSLPKVEAIKRKVSGSCTGMDVSSEYDSSSSEEGIPQKKKQRVAVGASAVAEYKKTHDPKTQEEPSRLNPAGSSIVAAAAAAALGKPQNNVIIIDAEDSAEKEDDDDDDIANQILDLVMGGEDPDEDLVLPPVTSLADDSGKDNDVDMPAAQEDAVPETTISTPPLTAAANEKEITCPQEMVVFSIPNPISVLMHTEPSPISSSLSSS